MNHDSSKFCPINYLGFYKYLTYFCSEIRTIQHWISDHSWNVWII